MNQKPFGANFTGYLNTFRHILFDLIRYFIRPYSTLFGTFQLFCNNCACNGRIMRTMWKIGQLHFKGKDSTPVWPGSQGKAGVHLSTKSPLLAALQNDSSCSVRKFTTKRVDYAANRAVLSGHQHGNRSAY